MPKNYESNPTSKVRANPIGAPMSLNFEFRHWTLRKNLKGSNNLAYFPWGQ